MGTGSLSGVSRPGRGADHPPPSMCRGHERVKLYLYSPSGPSWPVIGWPLPYLTLYSSPWGPPSLLYDGYRVFPGGKAAGAWCWPPTPIYVPRSWKGKAILLLTLWAFVACCRVTFTFTLPFILLRFLKWNLNFPRQIFKKKFLISNLIKIRPVGAELFHADRRMDGLTLNEKIIVAFRSLSNAK
jgi:hypothetical protein